MRLLMVSPGPPTSGGKGYQVRLYHQIRGLAPRHAVHLVTFADEGGVDAAVSTACESVTTVRWSPASGARSALINGARLPVSVALFRNREMASAVSQAVDRTRPDLVHLQMVRMAPYIAQTGATPTVLDLLDASALGMRERARASGPGLRQAMGIEATRLAAYERAAIGQSNLALLISSRDFEYAGSPANARVLANGVDPAQLSDREGTRDQNAVIFSGTMSFFPNVDAAAWFAREIMPSVRRSVPNAQFRIVGREPDRRVRRLAALPGVNVVGPVANIADEIARATVSVCPMRFGSGMQTKILEAMAAATPVVATGKAMEGIPEDLHGFVRRADPAGAFAREVAAILADPAPALQLAAEGLHTIRRDHSWSRHVGELERLYEETVRSSANARRDRRR